jgi:Pyruvate/2-oxoacid:ferredoxin oxidoreductase delta subunit
MDARNATKVDKEILGNAKLDPENEKQGTEKRDRGLLRVDQSECKGCGMCAEACPPRAIRMGEQLNHYGYRTASYAGSGCTGCGVCFMVCPEPGAITVMRAVKASGPHALRAARTS